MDFVQQILHYLGLFSVKSLMCFSVAQNNIKMVVLHTFPISSLNIQALMNFVLPEMLHMFYSHHSQCRTAFFFPQFQSFYVKFEATVLRLQIVCLFLCIHIYDMVTIHTKMNNIHTACNRFFRCILNRNQAIVQNESIHLA